MWQCYMNSGRIFTQWIKPHKSHMLVLFEFMWPPAQRQLPPVSEKPLIEEIGGWRFLVDTFSRMAARALTPASVLPHW